MNHGKGESFYEEICTFAMALAVVEFWYDTLIKNMLSFVKLLLTVVFQGYGSF